MLRSSATQSCDDAVAPDEEVAGDGWDVEDAPEHAVSAQARAQATTRPAVVTVAGPRRARCKRVGGVGFEHRQRLQGTAIPGRAASAGDAAP